MANQSVYPYGPGGSVPAGVGIINDLVTGGANVALSAEMGKTLAQDLQAVAARTKEVTDDDLTTGYVDNKFINTSGNIGSNNSYAYKEFTVKAGSLVQLTCYSTTSTAVIAKKLTSTKFEPIVTGAFQYKTYEYTATEDMTIAVSYNKSWVAYPPRVVITYYPIASNSTNVQNILSDLSERAQEALVQDVVFGRMFKYVAVIGDSLSCATVEGIVGQPDAAGGAFLSFSWIAQLARRWACSEWRAYATAGMSTAKWIAQWLPTMQADSCICDAYFIALGTNNEYDETVQTSDEKTAFIARYNSIIDSVRAKAPHAAIFVVSLYEKRSGNATLEDIAATRAQTDDGVYYLDYANTAKYLRYSSPVNWRGHFSSTGYIYVASVMNQLVNDVIWNNQTNEFWCQFAKYHNYDPYVGPTV